MEDLSLSTYPSSHSAFQISLMTENFYNSVKRQAIQGRKVAMGIKTLTFYHNKQLSKKNFVHELITPQQTMEQLLLTRFIHSTKRKARGISPFLQMKMAR